MTRRGRAPILAPASLLPLAGAAAARTALGRLRGGPLRPGWSFATEAAVRTLRHVMLGSRWLGLGWLRAAMSAAPVPASALAEVGFEGVDVGGVPGWWCRPRGARSSRRVLYLHGGGYVTGSVHGYREIVARLAAELDADVLAVDYRLSPEHPFPAAQDDCLAAARWLLAGGVAPEHLALAGDSAGGALALATMLSLRDAGEALPAAAWLISPWVDPLAEGGSLERFAEVDFATPALLRSWAAMHAPAKALEDPRLRPVAARLAGLPPLLVHVGGAEMLLDPVRAFCARAAEAGVAVRLEVGAEQIHDYPLMGAAMVEGAAARRLAMAWLRERLDA